MSLFSSTMAVCWWPEIRVVLFTQPRLMWPSVVRRINICMTLVCVPGPGWSQDTCWMFSSSSQVTPIRWKARVRISVQYMYFNSSRYFLIHLKHFNLSWTYFLYPHLKYPAHTWENNPSSSPTQESYFRPLLQSSLLLFVTQNNSEGKILQMGENISVVTKHCCLHDTDLDNLRMLIDDKKAVKLRL